MAPYFHIHNAKAAWLLYFCLFISRKKYMASNERKMGQMARWLFSHIFYFFCLKGGLKMPKIKHYKKESDFQSDLIKQIKKDLPESIVLKNDPEYKQGIPDLLIANGNKYAFLEVKKSKDEPHQPNQDYYIDKAKRESFGEFIFPENKQQILSEMYDYFNRK